MKNSLLLPLLLFCSLLSAQSSETLPSYAWLAGSWTGDGFGGTSHEVWSSPAEDGKMMGAYRHYTGEGKLNFYEFLVLDEQGIKLKHFTPELKGWEEKEDYLTFEMVAYDDNTIEMKGLVFKRMSENEMEIHLKMRSKDGSSRTEVFRMRRSE